VTGPPSPETPRSGNPELEIAEAYREHAQAVYRRAYRAALGDHHAAQDATQQAFLEAFRNRTGFCQLLPSEQRAWLCMRAARRIIDSWRATSHELITDTPPEQPSPMDGEAKILADIAADRFWKEITVSVPNRAARAAYLRWHEQWTMAEIARHLSVDRATVNRDLNNVIAVARQLAVRQIEDPTGLPTRSEGKEA
jgi:RNA polymerase sigma factor (sigma-70 family)